MKQDHCEDADCTQAVDVGAIRNRQAAIGSLCGARLSAGARRIELLDI